MGGSRGRALGTISVQSFRNLRYGMFLKSSFSLRVSGFDAVLIFSLITRFCMCLMGFGEAELFLFNFFRKHSVLPV